jgi:transcriptional regulator with XRE-family HTH domain
MINLAPGAKLGQEIRRRREARGMTLEMLAETAELTPNYIGSVEIGKRDPSLSTVLALAKGLGVRPGELFGTIAELSQTAEEAARLFDTMTPEMQKAVMSLLHSVSKRSRG